jgi:D-3-phosphoglycerate dehydrogenase
MGLILAADRNLPNAVADMRAGRWRKKHYSQAMGLYGRQLGLVGFGSIAREVAIRARAFGLQVSGFSRTLTEEIADAFDVRRAPSLPALLAESDIVSIHVPYSKATHHLFDAGRLARMKPGALLIHTARGSVVDDADLLQAVESGRIRAAVDVLEDEPTAGEAAFDSPLCRCDRVYATPHIGASTDQAESAIGDETVRIVREYLQSGMVPNVVNILPPKPACWTIVVRHKDRVGVLASILQALREEQLNVQQMQNVIFSGNEAACAAITLEREPSSTLVERLRRRDDILAVDVRAAP